MKSKKLVQINTVCNGSIGGIMHAIQIAADNNGYETISFYGRRQGFKDVLCEKFGNNVSFWIHVIINTLFDRQGFASYFTTRHLIKRLREIQPDIIHLHNLHGYYINLSLLVTYLKDEFRGRIVWTFHDCWPITGHCPYFTLVKCNKWKNQCMKCPNKKEYPISYGFDSSKVNYLVKKELFSGLNNLIIICPSQWMKNNVAKSFLKTKKIQVVYNGIDLDFFYYRERKDMIMKYSIPAEKKVLIGVANIWEKRKGLADFISLSYQLPERYVIVLVGLKQKQIKKLPSNIIGIERTENKEELAQLYSRGDVFVNPSEEESFSLVTVEALACGTPAIALDTSAVRELVNTNNGVILHNHDVKDYIDAIQLCEKTSFNRDKVRDTVAQYSIGSMTNHILKIYEENY